MAEKLEWKLPETMSDEDEWDLGETVSFEGTIEEFNELMKPVQELWISKVGE